MGKLVYSQFGLELRKQPFSVFSLCFFSIPELKLTEGENKAGREARDVSRDVSQRWEGSTWTQSAELGVALCAGARAFQYCGRWSSKEKILKKKKKIISP